MKKTKNYAMPYPEQDDYFNVEDFQDMMVSVDGLMKKLSDSGAQISSDAEHLYNQTKAQMDNIQKRMNAFTALRDGSTTGDAELKDIRVAYDGKEYGNAGEAVREQASDIHKALFGAGASIWSKAKSESTKYVVETKGICILNERFTAAGVVTKISRGTFAENESTLNLDRECSAYIVEFEKNPGTVYMPSAETIKIVSTTKIIFEANGNARCWIPVEKGQYLAVDSTATAYTCESNHVPYMLYNQANKTLEFRGFGATGSTKPVDPYSLALEYKLEYDMDDTGIVKQIDANRKVAALLKEDIEGVSNIVYTQYYENVNLLDSQKNSHINNPIKGEPYTNCISELNENMFVVIAIEKNDILSITQTCPNSQYPILRYLDKNKQFGYTSDCLPASSYSYEKQTNIITINTDAFPYAIIESRYSDIEVKKKKTKSNIPTKVSELYNDLGFISDQEKIMDVIESENIFDYENTIIKTGIMNSGSRFDETNQSYRYTDFIQLKSGIYTFQQEIKNTNRIRYAIYDKNKNPILYKDNTGVNIVEFTLKDDGYIRLCTVGESPLQYGMIFKGSKSAAKYIPYFKINALKPEYVYGNPLYMKKWTVCGDSFTYGAVENDIYTNGRYKGERKTYPFFIGERNCMDIVNLSMSGQTLATPSNGTDNNRFSTNIYKNIPEDTDYITIYLGINDSHHRPNSNGSDGENVDGVIPLGGIEDSTINTFYGAWNVVLEWMITNRPYAHIGIIVSNGCETDDYAKATIACAKKWGIAYLDLNGDYKVPLVIRTNGKVATSNEAITIRQNSYKVSETNLHPNTIAHMIESTFIENWMRSL